MISTATKTLQANNKMIYIALLSTLTFFLFLDYIPGLEACHLIGTIVSTWWHTAVCCSRFTVNSIHVVK